MFISICTQGCFQTNTNVPLIMNVLKNYVNTMPNVRNMCLYKYKYSLELEAAVNTQIQAEQQAAQDYLSMAVAFFHPKISRPGAGSFFMKMYEEELSHAQVFIHYQLLRGGHAIVPALNAPKPYTDLTLLEAFTKGLEMEKHVTELIEKLCAVAESKQDRQCADMVTSMFLAEQMKAVNDMSHHIAKLSRLCDEHAIYHYDLELAKSHPFKFKDKP